MQKTFAMIPSKGLGDLIITLGLAFNLSKDYKVIVYHPLIAQLHEFFPFIETRDRPQSADEIKEDKCLLIYETSLFFDTLYPELKSRFKDNLYTLNPVVTNKKDYRFVDEYFFKPKASFAANLFIFGNTHFYKDGLKKTAGAKTTPKDPHLVIIHATASKLANRWPSSRFLKIKSRLEKEGYQVLFATLPHEHEAINEGLYSGLTSLSELAHLIAKASLVIGNNSGVSHLASALHTPTLILSRNSRIQVFWNPDFEGVAYPICPSTWIPNLKGFRLRDRFWKYLIPTKRVMTKSLEILQKGL